MSAKKKEPVPNNIEALRKKSKMTRPELAARLGVAPGTVYYWERCGIRPDVDNTFKLMSIFDVSLDYLLGRTTS